MYSNQIKAYQRSQKLGLSRRQTESMAFTKAADMLAAASSDLTDRETYREALRYNQILWTIVQDSLFDDGSHLPERLRADLISLSAYVDRETVAAFARPDPARVGTLSQIARNVASGLRGSTDEPAAA